MKPEGSFDYIDDMIHAYRSQYGNYRMGPELAMIWRKNIQTLPKKFLQRAFQDLIGEEKSYFTWGMLAKRTIRLQEVDKIHSNKDAKRDEDDNWVETDDIRFTKKLHFKYKDLKWNDEIRLQYFEELKGHYGDRLPEFARKVGDDDLDEYIRTRTN